MKNFNPKVSIVIPVYNGSNYLSEAINSALAQTYKNIEIIVVNDGSTDNGKTAELAKLYGDKIKYFEKENGGVATALNFGIEKMNGKYFSWLSHDDIYYPNKIERQIEEINKIKKAELNNTIIASNFDFFNEKGIFKIDRLKKIDSFKYKHSLAYLFSGYINGCTLLIPKTLLIKANGFNELLPTTQDFDLWFRIFRNHKVVFINEILFLSRSHLEQGSKVLLNSHIKECDTVWHEKLSSLTLKEKEEIYDNEKNFYIQIYKFLSENTLYLDVSNYVNNKIMDIYKNEILNNKYSEDNFLTKIVDKEDILYFAKSSKPKLLFPIFGDYNDRGGLNKMVSMVVNGLSVKFNVIVTAFSNNYDGYELLKSVQYLQIKNSNNIVNDYINLCKALNVKSVIISHNCDVNALFLTRELHKLKIKVINWNHEDYFLPYYNTNFHNIWSMKNKILKDSNLVVWLTNSSCKVYNLFGSNGIVIPNFLESDNEIVKVDTSIKNNIIAIARFDDPRKRINLLLEVYEKILNANNKINLLILGKINYDLLCDNGETVRQFINRLNHTKTRVITPGFVKNIGDYYKKADINILPSYNEGFGLTILESSLYSVPTAVFDNSGFDDIIKNEYDGIIVPEADTLAMSKSILKYYSNANDFVTLKENSKKINEKFDRKRIVNLWINIINDVIDSKNIEFNEYNYSKLDIEKIARDFDKSLVNSSKKIIQLQSSNFKRESKIKFPFSNIRRLIRKHGILGLLKKILKYIFE